MSDARPAFDCKANDKLFGGARKTTQAAQLDKRRADLQRARLGELLIGLRKARALLEESEDGCLKSGSIAYRARLEMLGEAVSVVLEVERRMETALTKQKEGSK